MSDYAVFSFNLPEDLFFNIVLRLPVKSVLVCTCVCKTWNSFFKSPFFVSSHLNRTIASYKESDNHPYLLQSFSPGESESFSLGFGDQELSEFMPLHFPYRYRNEFQAICSCNGLVLLMNGFQSLILWNPLIRKSMVIETQKNCVSLEAAGLAFDSKTGDYKVLTIPEKLGDEAIFDVDLYSLKTNSWKRLSGLETYFSCSTMEMVFLNGAFHFIAARIHRTAWFVILGFDLGNEVFREIELPECMRNQIGNHFLWTFEESLSVVWIREIERDWELEIWVMKTYGVEDSWSHLSTVSLGDHLHRWFFNGSLCRKSGHILMSFSSGINGAPQMVLFDPRSQETKYLGHVYGKTACSFLGSYVESLILIDKGNDLSNLS